jgi:hypothetical protein
MTLIITIKNATLSIMVEFCYADVFMLRVIILNVIKLSVMAPIWKQGHAVAETMQYHGTEHNDIQHNDTQHKRIISGTQHE